MIGQWELYNINEVNNMKVELDIDTCYDCPHATNNAQLHDDPFTSGPSDIFWMCKKSGKSYRDWFIIKNAYNKIDPRCPLKQQ